MKYGERLLHCESDFLNMLDIKPTFLRIFREIDSTNTYLKNKAKESAPEGSIVLSKYQTEGRGRIGRSFFSPEDTGLYMSLLLRPSISIDACLGITSLAALCVAEAIESVAGVEAGIKWVNDVYSRGKKVCGILTEASVSTHSGLLDYAVLGIGINVFEPVDGFGELSDIAGAILPYSRNDYSTVLKLASETVNRFMKNYPHTTDRSFFEEYRRRLFILGKNIEVIKNDRVAEAEAVDIDDKYRLIVRYSDGTLEAISSGEVRVKLR